MAGRTALRSLLHALVAAVALGGASGCTAEETYLVADHDLQAARRLPPDEQKRVALPAARATDGSRVYVRLPALDLDPGSLQRADGIRVYATARARRPNTTVGVAVMLVGAGLSVLAGTLLGVGSMRVCPAAQQDCGDPSRIAGYGLLLPAAAHLVAGAALVVTGSRQRPQEVTAGRSDLDYLDLLDRKAGASMPQLPRPQLARLGFRF